MKTINRVIVTGASGFIGRALVLKLLKEKYKVVAVHRNNPINIKSNDLIKIRADLCRKSDLQKVKKYVPSASAFIHLAADVPKSGAANQKDYSHDLLMNEQLINILDDSTHFIFISSVDVAGNNNKKDLVPYAHYKLDSENILKQKYAKNKNKLCVLRLSHTYGPGDLSDKIINKLIRSKLNQSKIQMRGLNQTRDFIYINDVVNALEKIIQNNISGEYTLCSGKKISIENLFDLVIKDKPAKLQKSDYADNNIVDNLRIRKTNISKGIQETIRWTILNNIYDGRCKIFCDLDGVLLENKYKYFKLHSDIVKEISGHEAYLSLKEYWNLKRNHSPNKLILSLEKISTADASTYQELFVNNIEDEKYLAFDRVNKKNLTVLVDISRMNQLNLVTLRRNRETTLSQLNQFGIRDLLDEILINGPISDQPDKTRMVEASCSISKMNIMIGDTEDDFTAAENNNIPSIILSCGIRTKSILKQMGAKIICKNLNEFMDYYD